MPKGIPNNPNNKRGWGDMTAEERSQEMRRRMSHRKRRTDAVSTVTTLQTLVENLERQQAEFDATLQQLKQMLG